MANGTSLYDQIGEAFIRRAITEFYLRAADDMIIGHFFFQKDLEHITRMQIAFASNLLGGPKVYAGKALIAAHATLEIRPPHFGRRQVLMRSVLVELGLAADLVDRWMAAEEGLRSVVLAGARRC